MSEFKGILAGLGNPGEEYRETYHNVGLLFLDFLKEAHGWQRPGRRPFEYSLLNKIVLVRPLTYMNESGRALSSALSYFKVKPENLVIAQDESDLPLGEYKISKNRGAAGHKGILSVTTELGGSEFARIRIGIRKTSGKAGDFVLKQITKTDKEKLYLAFGEILKLIEKDQLPFSGF